MKKNNRWMKWVLETDADQVDLPWARKNRREFIAATRIRARAA